MEQKIEWTGKSIIVVDDAKKIQLELSAAYTALGLAVVGVASNGLEAIELYKKLKPDLVSMDIVMPVMHGIECYQKLHELNSEVKLFFVSCLAHDTNVINSLGGNVHAFRFVSKPWTAENLKRAIDNCFSKGALQTPLEANSKINMVA